MQQKHRAWNPNGRCQCKENAHQTHRHTDYREEKNDGCRTNETLEKVIPDPVQCTCHPFADETYG